MLNEWGLAVAPAQGLGQATTSSPTTPTLVGAGLGVLAGGLLGMLIKRPAIGAVAGGLVGAGGGYWYGTSSTSTTPAPTPSQ